MFRLFLSTVITGIFALAYHFQIPPRDLDLTYIPEEQILESYQLDITKIEDRVYQVQGQITPGDCEKFVEQIPERSVVYLHSPGGYVDEAICISKYVYNSNIHTVVSSEQDEEYVVCASACTFVFVSGKTRTLRGQPLIGFHAPGQPRFILFSSDPRRIQHSAFKIGRVLRDFLHYVDVDQEELVDLFFNHPNEIMYQFDVQHIERFPGSIHFATDYDNFYGFTYKLRLQKRW